MFIYGARKIHFFSPTSGIYSLDRCGTDFLRVAAPWGHDIEVCIGFPRYTGSRTRFPHYNRTLLRPCVSLVRTFRTVRVVHRTTYRVRSGIMSHPREDGCFKLETRR